MGESQGLLSYFTEYTCVALESPSNGGMSCNSSFLRIGTTCQFSCSPGYDLEGSSLRTCLLSVSWSGTTAQCTPKKCSDKVTNPPPFASVFQPCTGDFNTSCPVKCSSGYEQANKSHIVTDIQCQLSSDGQSVDWSADPVCTGEFHIIKHYLEWPILKVTIYISCKSESTI